MPFAVDSPEVYGDNGDMWILPPHVALLLSVSKDPCKNTYILRAML